MLPDSSMHNKAYAYTWDNCKISSYSPKPLTRKTKLITNMTIDVGGRAAGGNFIVMVGNYAHLWDTTYHKINVPVTVTSEGNLSITNPFNPDGNSNAGDPYLGDTYIFLVVPADTPHQEFNLCGNGTTDIPPGMTIPTVAGNESGEEYCKINFTSSSGNFKPGDTVSLKVNFPDSEKGNAMYGSDGQRQDITTKWSGPDKPLITSTSKDLKNTGVTLDNSLVSNILYTVRVTNHNHNDFWCENAFKLDPNGGGETGSTADGYISGTIPLACEQKAGNKFECNTAIGPISTDPQDFIKSILAIILSLAGGILILLFIQNGYKLMTSQGDPEKIKDAREGIIAAITGLLLIIFSLAILRILLVNVLNIPGFG